MAARTPAEAAEVFFDLLQRSVSVFTPAVLTGRAYRPGAEPFDMTFGRGDPVALGRNRDVSISVRHRYLIATSQLNLGNWSVRTVGYLHELLDCGGGGVLSYHWHPVGHSPVTFPHIHIGGRVVGRFRVKDLSSGSATIPAGCARSRGRVLTEAFRHGSVE